MSYDIEKYLDNSGGGENAFQKRAKDFARIQDETGIAAVPGHLGDPKAPTNPKVSEAMSAYWKHLAEHPDQNVGYADVAGDPAVRKHLAETAMTLHRFNEENANPDRLKEDHIQLSEKNIIGANGGTGALNLAIKVFDKDVTVLVPEPAYTPWFEIGKHLERNIQTYQLKPEHNYLLDYDTIEEEIKKYPKDKPIVLISHNPHNPIGKTLTKKEAEQTAKVLDRLSEKYSNFFIIEEELYLGTTSPNMGIYTPLSYLNDHTRAHTIVLHSPSKIGLMRDRGAFMMAFEDNILGKLRSALSVDSLGPSHTALLATAFTLRDIANGGLNDVNEPGSDPNNYRYTLGRFYKDKREIVAHGLKIMEEDLIAAGALKEGEKILPRLSNNPGQNVDDYIPQGAYYVFPSFDFMRGKPIPEPLHEAFRKKDPNRNNMTFHNAEDLETALQNAHLLGLHPVTIAPGTLFYKDEEKKKTTMDFRIATVAPEEDGKTMGRLVNTLKGVAQRTLEADGKKVDLGVEFYKDGELKRMFPAPQATPSSVMQNIVSMLTSRFFPTHSTSA